MSKFSRRLAFLSRGTFAAAVVALVMIGFGASQRRRRANRSSACGRSPSRTLAGTSSTRCSPVGPATAWSSTRTSSPILTGYVCYGTWIKLGGHSYGLTHPFFDFVGTTGLWDGTSGYFDYTVTVANDGNSFTGKENFTFEVPGTNPYAGGGTTFTGFTISATRITVNKSLLP